jgi:hypothetical protein
VSVAQFLLFSNTIVVFQELKHLFSEQPDLYNCSEGLRDKISIFLLYASTRKGDASVERVYRVFASLLAPALLNDEGQPTKSAEATLNAAQECLSNILGFGGAADKNVRLHICRLAHACIHHAKAPNGSSTVDNKEGDIAEMAWVAMRECLIPRLKDKNAAVRASAASALKNLQDGDGDEAAAELARLSAGDSSKEVRSAATSSFFLSASTLPLLLERTRCV